MVDHVTAIMGLSWMTLNLGQLCNILNKPETRIRTADYCNYNIHESNLKVLKWQQIDGGK
jgi:hypothetical protein